MHSNSVANSGPSSTRESDLISAEYHAKIAQIMDQTIAEANRLLRNLGPKANTVQKAPIERKVAVEPGPKAERQYNNRRCTDHEGTMQSTQDTSVPSLSGTTGSTTEYSGFIGDSRGFKNYVDTPSRYRSRSMPKILENGQEYVCQCSSKEGRGKSSECNCAREMERLYAGAIEKWVTSSRNGSPTTSSTTIPYGNATDSASTLIPYQSTQRMSAGGFGKSSPRRTRSTCTAPLSDLTELIARRPRRRRSTRRQALAAGSDAGSTMLNRSAVASSLNRGMSVQHGYVTIMHVDNVYFKCNCGHICQYPPPKTAPFELCLGKTSKQPVAIPSSPNKVNTEDRSTNTSTETGPRHYRALSPVHTARAPSRRSPPNRISKSDKVNWRKAQRHRHRSMSQKVKTRPKSKHSHKASAPKKRRLKSKKPSRKETRSVSSQTDATLYTARAPTPKLWGPRARTPQKSLAKALALRNLAARQAPSDTSLRTARACTPRRRRSPLSLSAKEAPDLTLNATFRVRDQETEELHTLVLKAEMQGKAIKKLSVNGKECKVR